MLTFVCCIFALFLNQLFSRQWIGCLKWVGFISSCLWFWSVYEKIRTEMGFEFTHGDRIGAAVPRLKLSATLAIFLTKHKQCCLYCSCLFLSIAKFIQHPERIKVYSPLWASFWQFFSNWMLSRHWVCCSEWGAGISACLNFRSLPKMVPTEMGFKPTHGHRIRLAVQRLNQWAALPVFID